MAAASDSWEVSLEATEASASSQITSSSSLLRPGTGVFLPRNCLAQAMQAGDGPVDDTPPASTGNHSSAMAATYFNSSSSRVHSGRLYSPHLAAHSRCQQADHRMHLEGMWTASPERHSNSGSSPGSSGCTGSMPLDMRGRSFSTPVPSFADTPDDQLLILQQQQQQCLGTGASSIASVRSGYTDSYHGNPADWNSPGICLNSASAAAAAALDDDVCVTASGWLDTSCQSDNAVAALHSLATAGICTAAGSSSHDLLPQGAGYSSSLASCYARRGALADGSSSVQLVFPSVFRPGLPRAASNWATLPFAATVAAAGNEAAASVALSGSYPSTPRSSCTGSPQSFKSPYNGLTAAAAATFDLEQQLCQMQLAGASNAAETSPFAADSHSSGRCHYPAPEMSADALQLGSYENSSPITDAMQQQQLVQQGCSYSSVLPLPADQFDVAALQAASVHPGCCAGGVSSLSAPLRETFDPVHVALMQQGQLGMEAIDQELQQLMQARDQLAASRAAFDAARASNFSPAAMRLQEAAIQAPPHTSAPLLASQPAPHYGSSVQGLAGSPRSPPNALGAYMVVHHQQQQRHQLCMESVSQSARLRGGSLSAAAQRKLVELLALQKMQMGLHEELLQSLGDCIASSGSSGRGR